MTLQRKPKKGKKKGMCRNAGKVILSVLLTLTIIALLAATLLTPSADAGRNVYQSFINQGQSLSLSNNTVLTNWQPGVSWFYYRTGTNIQSLYTNIITQTSGSTTYTNAVLYQPNWEEDVKGPFTDGLGGISSNVVFVLRLNDTNLIPAANQSVGGTLAIMASNPPVVIPTAASTNNVTIMLAPYYRLSQNNIASNNYQFAANGPILYGQSNITVGLNGLTMSNTFTIKVQAAGTSPQNFFIPIPTSFLYAADGLTVVSNLTDNAAGSPGVLETQMGVMFYQVGGQATP